MTRSRRETSFIFRTIGLVGSLSVLLSLIIIAFCSVLGIVGSLLVDTGIVHKENLYDPVTVLTVIFLGSAALALVLSLLANRTLVRPIRLMTAAMGELARGNFNVRFSPRMEGWLRETREFGRSFDVAAEELGNTEIMRSGFIRDFSHEFRTPITTLSGFAQLLREGGLSEDERAEYLDIIVEESERLASLSERILVLSKIEASTVLPDVERVDIAAQLRRAATMAAERGRDRRIAVEVSAGSCPIDGNADYLMQLWTNLLDNAVKFSPEGGTVSVALYAKRQDDESHPYAPSTATVWVSDEGPGISAEERMRIFDKFYQADGSRASAGNGLGLALCKRIAELHGGSIEVESTPSAGATFEVRIPLRR